jgi:hypothetical protein
MEGQGEGETAISIQDEALARVGMLLTSTVCVSLFVHESRSSISWHNSQLSKECRFISSLYLLLPSRHPLSNSKILMFHPLVVHGNVELPSAAHPSANHPHHNNQSKHSQSKSCSCIRRSYRSTSRTSSRCFAHLLAKSVLDIMVLKLDPKQSEHAAESVRKDWR